MAELTVGGTERKLVVDDVCLRVLHSVPLTELDGRVYGYVQGVQKSVLSLIGRQRYAPADGDWFNLTLDNLVLPTKTLELKGITHVARTGKWIVRQRRDGKTQHVGSFATLEEAVAARDAQG